MHKWRKSPSRAPLRRESDSPLFSKASRVKLIQGLLAPLRPTTTYLHGSGSLTRFHSPLCLKEHVELIPSDYNTYAPREWCLNSHGAGDLASLGFLKADLLFKVRHPVGHERDRPWRLLRCGDQNEALAVSCDVVGAGHSDDPYGIVKAKERMCSTNFDQPRLECNGN